MVKEGKPVLWSQLGTFVPIGYQSLLKWILDLRVRKTNRTSDPVRHHSLITGGPACLNSQDMPVSSPAVAFRGPGTFSMEI